MLVSILFFMVIRTDTLLMRAVSRILLIPAIAGVSYEVLRFAGTHDNLLVNLLSRPGMWMQELTTKEPDPQMAEVAIAAVEAVFDWRAYLKENFGWEESASQEESVSQEVSAAAGTDTETCTGTRTGAEEASA